MKKIVIIFAFFLTVTSLNLKIFAQNEAKEDFYFDAIVFKATNQNETQEDSARVDIFAIIPNETLNFLQSGEIFNAKFELIVTVTNSANNQTISRSYSKNIFANSFIEAQGSGAEFTQIAEQIKLAAGNYKIKAVLKDMVSQREFEKNRMITVINFNNFTFAMSSLMFVNSIEENSGKYLISPHITDNIGNLSEGFFVFFEVYNDKSEKNVEIIAEISDVEANKIIFTERINRTVNNGTNQIYMRIPNGINYGLKNNMLKILITESHENFLINDDNYLINNSNSSSNSTNNKEDSSSITVLAAASRSIKCITFLSNRIAANLTNAVRQMRYVASSQELDFINESANETEKMKRFESFWKALDPTPHTEQNEALEEYYFRIDYANKNFKAYSAEGWLSDKGQVFIVFGMPMNVERTNKSFADNRTYEQWIYANNRIFIFLDTSGFGDFRLYNPRLVTDKYQYEN